MNMRLRGLTVSVRGMALPGVMVAVLAGCAQPDLAEVQRFVETTKRTTPVKKLDPPPEIKPYTPFAYTAQGGKDPFVVAAWAGEEVLGDIPDKVQQSGANYTGLRPDPNRVREDLEKYSLGSLKMMGTFRMGGGNGGELWALILAPDGVVHRVQKNNYLGMNHGKIAGITEQRVELKEIVPDGPGRWQERDAFLSLTQ
ncbi:MAG: pilus assembly protein PilP [Candidatus Competibacter sp.]|nr:pilus assembly protein PilP [Candidatus Competibacter sp.]MDG4607379.1 pilus assembly protein PilP [Candidatus Contendobacter sp.]HRD48254.1 pilus assembly protein PilP [Candidatus Contendobacter sp.]